MDRRRRAALARTSSTDAGDRAGRLRRSSPRGSGLRRLSGRTLAALGAGVLVLVGGVGAAVALSSETPRPDVTGTAGSTGTSITLSVRSTIMQCRDGQLDFGLDPGAAVDDTTPGTMAIGTVGASRWNVCRGPGGWNPAIEHVGSWGVQATSSLVGGSGTIRLTDVAARVTSPQCSFAVAGSAAATLDIEAGTIGVLPQDSSVTASDVRGCLGRVQNSDVVGLSATFAIPVP